MIAVKTIHTQNPIIFSSPELDKIQEMTGFSESEILQNALDLYIQEVKEDFEDLIEAKKALEEIESGKQKLIPAEEVYKELGL